MYNIKQINIFKTLKLLSTNVTICTLYSKQITFHDRSRIPETEVDRVQCVMVINITR